ncbi:tRNA(Met) cytidine acetyltransferase TmcA [Nitrincola sp.]|uniref:tRNA(Met) cytidine acetyltransferase TmcA n=1 Tax=Nitrincola sp. TaxID=1926584 RepID=UPI003A928200
MNTELPPGSQFRACYWLQAAEDAAEASLQHFLSQQPVVEQTLLISERSLAGIAAVSAREALQWLGSETDRVIFDAFCGFNPNAFAQVCGTLRGGGELILLTPPADQWSAYADPEYAALRGSRYHQTPLAGYFLQRLTRELLQVMQPGALAWCLPLPDRSATTPYHHPYLSKDQEGLVASLSAHFQSAALAQTVVITADRGRGKSASLGLALASLCQQQALNVCVCAPQRSAVDALFVALQRQLPEGQLQGSGFSHPALQVRFYPPAVLVQKSPEADLIIVDEAAAISVTLLKAICQHWPRQWFATTLHGYEGNGRGFEQRFLQYLTHSGRPWQEYQLHTPVRWVEQDPLEALSYRLLLLDAEPPALSEVADSMLVYRTLSAVDLLTDEVLLHQLFGLLIAAHYRTTPNDLRQLLDSPDLQLRVLQRGRFPVAVALLVEEGPLDAELAQGVWAGQRRPGGDLIPQTLVAREGWLEAAELQGWRVMRIAVHPALQSQGLGSALLTQVQAEAREKQLDFCAAAFAATPGLLRFWQHNAYAPLRMGERCDAVTAGWPVLVFQALSDRAEVVSHQAQLRFESRFLLRLAATPQAYDTALILACLTGLRAQQSCSQDSLQRLQGFAHQQRGFEDSLPEIRQLLGCRTESANMMKYIAALPDADQELLIARVLRLESPQQAAYRCHIQGQRLQLQRLRHWVAQLLAQLLEPCCDAG